MDWQQRTAFISCFAVQVGPSFQVHDISEDLNSIFISYLLALN